MRELSTAEVLDQLRVCEAGTDEERAAALAVIAAAISESHNLGRLVLSQGASSWTQPQLRADLAPNQNRPLRRPIN